MSLPAPVAKQAIRARRLADRVVNAKRHSIYQRFSEFTMVSRLRYVDNLELSGHVRGLQGAIVECGVWRGGMIGGLAQLLGPERQYVPFDNFEGLPPAQEIDGPTALKYQANPDGHMYHDNCAAEVAWARRAMALAGANDPDIRQGWFADTMPAFAETAPPIALLRLDGDWYESTMTALEHLFPLVVSGGYVLIDDYETYDGCNLAVHRYLSDHDRPEAIRRTPSGVANLVKR